MKQQGVATKFATGFAAASLLISSTASAAPAVRAIDYMASASVLSTASIQTAACAAGAAATAAASAAAQGAQPGCVLPAVDAPPPVPVTEAPPPPVYVAEETSRGGIGVLPILLGLAAIAGGLLLLLDDDDDDDEAISPG